jgi:uncharacterized protein
MLSRGRRVLILVAAALLLLIIVGRLAADFLVDLLWFRSLGFEAVYWRFWTIGAVVRTLGGILIAAAVALNLWVVSRSFGGLRLRRRYGNIEIAERLPHSYVVGAILLVSLISGWWLSIGLPDPFSVAAAARHHPWGVQDPIFGRDVAFYVFYYPLLARFQTLAGLVVFWTALLAVAAYVASGALKGEGGTFTITANARRHLGMLAAAMLLVFAAGIWLDRYEILLAGSGIGGAVGYTDVQARLPGKLLVLTLALAAAAAVAVGAWRGSRREPLVGLGLLIVGALGAQVVYPSMIQRLVVEPNEFPREQPYITHHLEFTRLAYGLRGLTRAPLLYQAAPDLSDQRVREILAGVPLWDERPLLTAFRQRQSLFPYYDFVSVHADRYAVGDRLEQVAIAVRELDTSQLPDQAQTWQNLHLNYVHGVGAVVSPMARMAGDGAPAFYLWDLEPKIAANAPPGLQMADPRVYFGQRTRGYIAVGPEHGPVGVPLDARWKKLLFAWAFQSRNLVLSRELGPETRIVFQRQIHERLRALAPFLRFPFEGRPYPAVVDGRIVWIADGYTTSAAFPLSIRALLENTPLRYVRNSVKATIDGVSGEVRFYIVDPEDPLIRTYADIFPELFLPMAEMPEAIARQLRYPAPLHGLQAQVLGDYHLRDARAFYAREDVWSIATENYADQPVLVRPTYITLPLPGQDREEFLLKIPFVSRGRQNMTALLVARNDPPHYGEQILFEFPRDELIPGPQQVESMIDQDPDISQQLSLWRQSGSRVIRGHLVVVPFDGTLLYIEPLFLEAENAAIPQLERVILAHRGRVVMAPTLPGAIAGLLGEGRGQFAIDRGEAQPERPAALPAATAVGERMAIERAQRLLEEAEAQLRGGDWAGFGRTWNALREALAEGRAAAPRP